MKKCSYCGAEYPDDSTVCAVDKTPLDTSPLAEAATVAAVSKRKIPIALSLVSYYTFASGVFLVSWGVLFAYLGRILLPYFAIGILTLFMARGLRRCSRFWRSCALVFIWAGFFQMGFYVLRFFVHSDHVPSIGYLIAYGVDIGILVCCYWVLMRPDIRGLFYDHNAAT